MVSSMGPRNSMPSPCENVQRKLVVVDTLGDRGVFEQRAQLGRKRKAQRDLGCGANACSESGFLLLDDFDNVKQRERSLPVALGFDFHFCFSNGGRRGIQREGETLPACGGIEVRGLHGGGFFDQLVLDGFWCGCKFFEQRGEFELGKELAAALEIRLLRFHRMQVELDRDMAVDGDEFFREQDRFAILLQRFAIGLALDFSSAVEHRFQTAEFLDQVDAALVADAGRAGNVVDAVAAQGHYIDDFFGRHAESLLHPGGVENQVVLLRVEDFYLAVDQLHHVLVARDDEDLVARVGGLARARVPMTSSASKPSTSRMGMRKTSRERRMKGICWRRSAGMASRLAL